MYSVHKLAKYIIRKSAAEEMPVSNLQLQKILYYIQGYSYKNFDEAAFDEPIYRWPYGPVVPEVYFEYNKNRAAKIHPNEGETDEIRLNRKHKKVFDAVINKCIPIRPGELVEKTHMERPWKETTDEKEISNELICEFFCENDPLKLYEGHDE